MSNDKLKILKILSAVGGILILDRFLKMFVQVKSVGVTLVPRLLQLNFYANDKGPFSLPIPPAVTIIISIILVAIFLILIFPPPPTSPSRGEGEERCLPAGDLPKGEGRTRIKIRLPLILITAGAASNLFDRIFYGYTIDTFQFLNFSFFNLADGLIFAGIIFLILKLGIPDGSEKRSTGEPL